MKKNNKRTAAVSLGIMGAGFAAAFPIAHTPFGFVLQSGFEAGLVGGLADWFAVTALFRHPLGIPIPHTALLPRNRNKVTSALVNAIQTNLLTKESIIEKTKAARVAERIAEAAKRQLERDDAGERISKLAVAALAHVSPESVAAALVPLVREAVRQTDAESVLSGLCELALEGRLEEPALDYMLEQGARLMAGEDMRQRLGALALAALESVRLGGLMGLAVGAFAGMMNEQKLGGMIQDFLLTLLYDMRRPGNTHREAVLGSLRNAVSGLPENSRVLQEANRWKENIASGASLETAVTGMTEKLWGVLSALASDPHWCRRTVVPAAAGAIRSLESRPDVLERIDGWIQTQAAAFVERNHDAIGKLVKENADKLDNETLIDMLEHHVGNDLQWIRVNGAVCGFAIGIALGLVQWFVFH